MRTLLSLASCVALAASPQLRAQESPAPRVPLQEAAEPRVAESGKILGVGIGMTLKEAREKLEPFRDPDAPRDEKEKYGSRAYFKLRETEYDWMMVWANPAKKIVRIRAVLRDDQRKPFSEIGDMEKAARREPNTVAWNLACEAAHVRIAALGSDGLAVRISILALDPALPQPPADDDAE